VKRPRLTVGLRLLLCLCGLAAGSIVLALALQHRALSADLERAAGRRLEGAASAANRLIERHLLTQAERYAAISKAPELRANLEVRHGPTLAFYASELAAQQHTALLLFADSQGRSSAAAGDRDLVAPARASLRDGGRGLVAHRGRLFAAVQVPLETSGRLVGRLLAVEPIDAKTLEEWSALCGARVSLSSQNDPEADTLGRVVRSLEDLDLRVVASLDEERHAVANSRRSLLAAGIIALGLALVASGILSQGLVRPIRQIQAASERIASGDLSTRLRTARADEIGEVSRAFDLMLDRLEQTMGLLRENESRLAGAQRRAHLGSFSLDPQTGELVGSRELRRVLAVDPALPLDLAVLLERVHPEDREEFAVALETCVRDGTAFELDHRSTGVDVSERTLHSQAERVNAADGTFRVEGTVQDVTDRKLVEEQVRYLAYHDSLTSLGNRRLFKERLALALDESRRAGGVLGVLFLDLDGFKLINDTLGHSAGDHLLKEVAERLVNSVRSPEDPIGSTVRAAKLVARLGGDEFTILLGDIRGPQDVARVARRVLRALAEPLELDGHRVVVGASIGITTSPPDGDDVDTLLRNCDTAMYHAKEQGRNNYQFFAESMNTAVLERLVLENRLRGAIEREELELYYQPRIDLETESVAGFEALARWRDSELGVVPPTVFIPLAEDAGLIRAIGDWALRAAVRQLAEWDAAGISARLSVNLSGHQLGAGSLLRGVVEALRTAAVDPQRLELEITETALLQDESSAISILEQLRAMGVSIALDDFGTGYSSLSYLLRLPVDTLKIDRSFIQRVDEEAADAALVGAIVSMAKIRGLRVVAEGVESAEQLAVLRELGCDEVQGHLFSPALPASEIPGVVRELSALRKPEPDARGARTSRGRARPPRSRPPRSR
jgi:diguanylate cyclase (GGDEF)-like protein